MVSQTFDRRCTEENGIQMVVILFRAASDLKSNSILGYGIRNIIWGKKCPSLG